jgi:NADPH-dependent ferric siderophore reductase
MSATTVAADTALPMVLAEVEVVSAERVSPSFVRIVLGGDDLADVGVAGPLLDQRFKLVVPASGGGIATVAGADATWLSTWSARPVEERGHMRTYTVRALQRDAAGTRVVVDVVVHDDGATGPGAEWALAARPGTRAVAVLPRRGHPFGGIEFEPPPGHRLLLVGDETAVPAVCAILECLPDDARGTAYLEVPHAADVQDVRRPAGVEVTWLVRGEREHGVAVREAVLGHLGAAEAVVDEPEEVDPDLWETPSWSSSGEPLDGSTAGDHRLADVYAWVAGESAMVTGLRRHLVRELGMDRRQVAFMGYWRRGVAMRS